MVSYSRGQRSGRSLVSMVRRQSPGHQRKATARFRCKHRTFVAKMSRPDAEMIMLRYYSAAFSDSEEIKQRDADICGRVRWDLQIFHISDENKTCVQLHEPSLIKCTIASNACKQSGLSRCWTRTGCIMGCFVPRGVCCSRVLPWY